MWSSMRGAGSATVVVSLNDNQLDIEVSDDGVGGADPGHGSGLTGLRDRVDANNGTLVIVSPFGGGTAVRATLPVALTTEVPPRS